MHPFFLKRERLFAYVLGWLGFSLLASLAVSTDQLGLLDVIALLSPVAMMHSFVSLSSWYICRSLPLRETPNVRLYVSLLSAGIVGGFVLVALLLGWSWFLERLFGFELEMTERVLRIAFGVGVTLHLLGIVFHYLLLAFESSRIAERRSLESEVLARSAELKALRAQIDPHFLYNSLNSISALIAANPGRAREMTVQLADFFRASVSAGRQHLITLRQEFDLVRNYLDIERVRHGERLRVEMVLSPEVEGKNVPPLILQPLIENAIKHGIAHLVEGGIVRVEAVRVGEDIRVTVANPFDADARVPATSGTTFGLKAVRDRIEAVSGGRGAFTSHRNGATYTATVSLPGNLS